MVTERLIAALAAMNRQYYAGIKWLPHIVTALMVTPLNFSERLAQCFAGDLRARVRVAAALVEDTFDLAEQQVPGLDVVARRAAFRARRPPVDRLPDRLACNELRRFAAKRA